MADRIKVLPIVILAVLLALAVLLYWVSRRPRETPQDPAGNPAPPAAAQGTAPPVPPKGTVEAPPPAKDPGEKILEGADNAYQRGWYDAALKFYKDFELRYAGTDVYDRHITKIWERIHTSGASMPRKDESLPAYLEGRRKLADEWKRIKPLLGAPPTPESRATVRKFFDSLPPGDGRLKLIEPWQDEKK